jgi:hypothetical protein
MPVFFSIVGLPRSGTTFLASYFSKFEKVYVCPELFWLMNYDLHGLDYTIKDVLSNRLVQDGNLKFDAAEIQRLPFTKRDAVGDLLILLKYLAVLNGLEYIGLNTPSNYYYTGNLLNRGFKVIIVTRKLSQIASSYSRISWVRNGYIVPLLRYPKFRRIVTIYSNDCYIVDYGSFHKGNTLLDCVKNTCDEMNLIERKFRNRNLVKINDEWSKGHFDKSNKEFDLNVFTWKISRVKRYVSDVWEFVFASGFWINWRLIFLLNPVILLVLIIEIFRNKLSNVDY